MKIKDEIDTSLKLCSLKGVPRAFATKHPILKILWVIGVMLFLGICAFQVYLNFSEYFSYPKVVTIEEKKLGITDPSQYAIPTVTVCNMNPFTNNISIYRSLGIPTLKEYYKIIDSTISCDKTCSFEMEASHREYRNVLKSVRGYYQHIGADNIVKISDQNLVMRCNIAFLHGLSEDYASCEQDMNITSFVSPDLGNCLRYQAKTPLKRILTGINFITYADNIYHNVDDFDLESYNVLNNAGGFIFMLYDGQNVPILHGDITTTPVGQLSNMIVSMKKIKRLSRPYSDQPCLSEDEVPLVKYDGTMMKENHLYCLGQCTQKFIQDRCNCSNIFVIHHPETRTPDLPYCGSLHQDIKDTIGQMACSNKHSQEAVLKCEAECKISCSEMKYNVKASMAKWPLPSQVASFYEKVIEKSTLATKFMHYRETFKAMRSNMDNVSAIDRLLATQAIENNFAKTSFMLGDFFYLHYETKPKLSVTGFISQLGGALNLWSGISVVVIIEFLDFIFRVCFALYTKESEKQADKGELSQSKQVSSYQTKRIIHHKMNIFSSYAENEKLVKN